MSTDDFSAVEAAIVAVSSSFDSVEARSELSGLTQQLNLVITSTSTTVTTAELDATLGAIHSSLANSVTHIELRVVSASGDSISLTEAAAGLAFSDLLVKRNSVYVTAPALAERYTR